MNLKFENLSENWKTLAHKAKNEQSLSQEELFEVFKETHKAFSAISPLETVPREAFQVVMLMDEFTYFASIANENYLGEYTSGFYYLNYALKDLFFKSNYQSEFFFGETPRKIRRVLENFENLTLNEFILFLKGKQDD